MESRKNLLLEMLIDIFFRKELLYSYKKSSQSSKKGKLFWICSMSSTKLRSDDHIWADQRENCTSLLLLDSPLIISISEK